MTVLAAPAKLTLSLRITGIRPDGYHEIDAEMVTVNLADTLIVEEGDGLEVVDETTAGARSISIDGDDNLVRKALRLCQRSAKVVLIKRIPSGAGLGGGSADAAAILRWAGYRDVRGAASIGADVSFCVIGGRARVGGIGEDVVSLPFESRAFTLLTPPFGCPTPAVYRRWDELGGPSGDHGNDLEPAALAVEPRLARYRDELAAVSGQRPRLAGSGSTWYVDGQYPGEGRVVVQTVPAAAWAG